MLRNGYHMPRYKSSLCSVDWMQAVKVQDFFCPLAKDCSPIVLATPPKLDLIIVLLEEEAARSRPRKRLGFTEKCIPDKSWAIQVLFYFNPKHKFFDKGFEAKRVADEILVANDDHFFDNLPIGPMKKRMGGIFKEPAENKLLRQIDNNQKRLMK